MGSSPSRYDIRRVVVLLAGSRTGSSYLFKKLRSVGEFISPTGEETPFYRLAGICSFDGKSYSDEILTPPPASVLDRAAQGLLADCGVRTSAKLIKIDFELFVEDCFSRVQLQWPGAIAGGQKNQLKARLIEKIKVLPLHFDRWNQLYFDWLSDLQRDGFKVEPNLLNAQGASLNPLALIEEPPFIAPEPRLQLTQDDCDKYPLLLKTSTNVYRTEFLRALFPNAEFKWVLLQRNPAATIGALMDGWLSNAFQSYDLQGHVKLEIKDYSDVIAGGQRYWKFDMPPGWFEYVQKSLIEVCAFQWFSAHKIIEDFSRHTKDANIQVKYEDLIESGASSRILREVFNFSQVAFGKIGDVKDDEYVASVRAPVAGRWRSRAQVIEPLLNSFQGGKILELAEKLKYERGSIQSWP